MASELLLNLTDGEKEWEKSGGVEHTKGSERGNFKRNSFVKISSLASFDEVWEL